MDLDDTLSKNIGVAGADWLQRRIVLHLITGPPRSGTSLVCQILQELGADFRPELGLIEPDRWNPKGYFESKAIVQLNHRLMFGSLGRPSDWLESDWQTNVFRDLRKSLTLMALPLTANDFTLQRRFSRMSNDVLDLANAFRGAVAKDPRFCITMGAWVATGQVDRALFCWRMPATTAASLSRQSGHPKWLMRRVWLDSLSRFLTGPKPPRVSLVNSENLMDPGAFMDEMRTLYAFANVDFSPREATRIWSARFDAGLRHVEARSELSSRESRLLRALHALAG